MRAFKCKSGRRPSQKGTTKNEQRAHRSVCASGGCQQKGTFKVPAPACLWTAVFCLQTSASAAASPLVPRAASLRSLRLLRRQPALGSSRQRDKHPTAIKSTEAGPAAHKAASWLATQRRAAPNPTTRWRRRNSWPANQSLKSAGDELVWRSSRRGGRIQRHRAGWRHSEPTWHSAVRRQCTAFLHSAVCLSPIVVFHRQHRSGAVVQQRGHVHLI